MFNLANANFQAMDIKVKMDTIGISSFKIGLTVNINVYKYRVRYFAVNSAFPFHFNIIEHYTPYEKVTITTLATATFTPTYSSILPAIATYRAFPNPASNYNIISYVSCFVYAGTAEPTSPPPTYYPPGMNISAVVVSNTTFTLTMAVKTKAYIEKIHFTLIVYDAVQIQNSRQYILNYARVAWPAGGGNYQVSQPYWDSVIFGWTDFIGSRNTDIIFFNLQLALISGTNYGIVMPASAPLGAGQQPISNFGYSLFYLQFVTCPNSTYYYDYTLNLCVLCESVISNCATCLNSSYCKLCDSPYLIDPTFLCSPCPITNCNTCINYTNCLQCNYASNYALTANGTAC